MDTIYAVASGGSVAGVCVIRVSGPAATSVALSFCDGKPLPPRRPVLRRLIDPSGELIDIALVLFFERGRSFTGQDTVEFNIHGSPAIMSKLLGEIGRIEGTRAAQPGEFTRLALEHGNLDLTQVEGLSQLLVAETEEQRRQAIRVFDRGVGKLVDRWRQLLITAASTLEVAIDFSDENIELDWDTRFYSPLRSVLTEIHAEVSGQNSRKIVNSGFEVALVGATNVGKSTLLNALAGREVAITSSIAGTTRDVIEVRMNLDGFLVTFLDTAGLRETEDDIEKIGMSAGQKRAENADLRIALLEFPGDEPPIKLQPGDIVVHGKADRQPVVPGGVSGLTGQGVSELIHDISAIVRTRIQQQGVIVSDRQAEALRDAEGLLQKIVASPVSEPELVAMEISLVVQAMDCLIGRVGVEDYLDEVFSSFCIGK